MRNYLTLLCVLLSFAVLAQNNQKVKIQHKNKVISVSVNAVDAHLAHGDVVLCDQAGYHWDNTQKTCVPSCPAGSALNPSTGNCESICDSSMHLYYDPTLDDCVYDPCRNVSPLNVSFEEYNSTYALELEGEGLESLLMTMLGSFPDFMLTFNGNHNPARHYSNINYLFNNAEYYFNYFNGIQVGDTRCSNTYSSQTQACITLESYGLLSEYNHILTIRIEFEVQLPNNCGEIETHNAVYRLTASGEY